MPRLNLWRLGMGWKRDFVKGWPCGKDVISQKEGELLLFEAPFLVCLYTLCLCFAC